MQVDSSVIEEGPANSQGTRPILQDFGKRREGIRGGTAGDLGYQCVSYEGLRARKDLGEKQDTEAPSRQAIYQVIPHFTDREIEAQRSNII